MKRKRTPRRWGWLALLVIVLLLALVIVTRPVDDSLRVVGCMPVNAPGRDRVSCVDVTKTTNP